MTIAHIIVLAIIQGLAELLPVSSSAHVVVAERLLGMDASAPAMTLLLVMLHTGTMFAVIVYFWPQWRSSYFQSRTAFGSFTARLVAATALTAPALAAAGLLICIAGWWSVRNRSQGSGAQDMSLRQASIIGLVQGVSLP